MNVIFALQCVKRSSKNCPFTRTTANRHVQTPSNADTHVFAAKLSRHRNYREARVKRSATTILKQSEHVKASTSAGGAAKRGKTGLFNRTPPRDATQCHVAVSLFSATHFRRKTCLKLFADANNSARVQPGRRSSRGNEFASRSVGAGRRARIVSSPERRSASKPPAENGNEPFIR